MTPPPLRSNNACMCRPTSPGKTIPHRRCAPIATIDATNKFPQTLRAGRPCWPQKHRLALPLIHCRATSSYSLKDLGATAAQIDKVVLSNVTFGLVHNMRSCRDSGVGTRNPSCFK